MTHPAPAAVSRASSKVVDYDHGANRHTVTSPQIVLPLLFASGVPQTLLDVGCGIGTWAAVAGRLGVAEVVGVDGVDVAAADLLIPRHSFHQVDLTRPWSLGRTFDLALCLEVAEHLEPAASGILVDALVGHAEQVVFSAACPEQPGQHHVNCQWPAYWQSLFNARGFACSDAIRWRIWNDGNVDVWYRQNMFVATRDARAGREPRLHAVIHPEFLVPLASAHASRAVAASLRGVRAGSMPVGWYATCAWRAISEKVQRRLGHHG